MSNGLGQSPVSAQWHAVKGLACMVCTDMYIYSAVCVCTVYMYVCVCGCGCVGVRVQAYKGGCWVTSDGRPLGFDLRGREHGKRMCSMTQNMNVCVWCCSSS